MTLTTAATLSRVLADLSQLNPQNKVYYTSVTKDTGVSSEYNVTGNGIQLLTSQDPFDNVVAHVGDGVLTTVTTEQLTALKALPHLYSLKGSSTVVNIDLNLQDYSIVPTFKDLGYPTFISNDLDTVVAHGTLAYQLAISNKEPVFHFINFAAVDPATVYNQELDLPRFQFEELAAFELENAEHFKTYPGASASPSTLVINLSPYGPQFAPVAAKLNALLVDIAIYRPWTLAQFLEALPGSIRKIAIVEGSSKAVSTTGAGFDPLLLDFFDNFNALAERKIDQIILSNVGRLSDAEAALTQIVNNVQGAAPEQSLYLGEDICSSSTAEYSEAIKNVINLEAAYIKVLNQLFDGNLNVLNEYGNECINTKSPEYGFGAFLHAQSDREALVAQVKKSLDPALFSTVPGANELVKLLSQWVSSTEAQLNEAQLNEANDLAQEIYTILQGNQDCEAVLELLKLAPSVEQLLFRSHWLIGSDAWSYDLGNSGVHHVITSKKNINMLIIDSEPYSEVAKRESKVHKKNVGLYAMNFHDVYVASVAVYSSYTQLLTAFIEASSFNGPSVILAYLPYHSENDTALEVLKETKNAVESGYWPLYRYDPRKEDDATGEIAFTLDSAIIKKELQTFLDRENLLTLLTNQYAELSKNLELSVSDAITRKQENRAKAAYTELLEGLSGPPLHIYYASDGGNATAVATKLCKRALSVGLKATVLSMDDILLEDLAGEENVIFVTSTAGQGEFPQDGKTFWEELKGSNDIDLSALNFAVFGLGDSQYWPRKEDAHYFNKPAKDLFGRLELSAAKPLIPLGLGDDQDADGFQTAYSEWEPKLWESLGVSAEGMIEEKPWTNEDIKATSDFLRGGLAEGLVDESTLNISADDTQLAKFHGLYMQDDRDIRETRKAQGLEPLYAFMARVRLPGGIATPDQWLTLDGLSDETGNGTMKITTRATFQLHGIFKKDMKHTMRTINSQLLDSLAAAGDVNRNLMVSALPGNAKVHKQISQMGYNISEALLPNTTAYYDIWLKGPDARDKDPNWEKLFQNRQGGPTTKKTLLADNSLVDVEPLYGPVYLPRKFKVNITVPPYNDVDVWSSDIGMIAIVDPATDIVLGYNMYAGGGMGSTHNNKKTYARRGSFLGFIEPNDCIQVIQAVVAIQRDNGCRSDRKHARLKYTIDDMSIDVFNAKVEEAVGKKFGPERPFEITSNCDYFGWIKDESGMNHFTSFVENGRLLDTPDKPQRTGFKKVAEYMKETGSGDFRLTGNQHVLICNIADEHLDNVKAIMKKYCIDNTDLSGIRKVSSSCVGLPTCGLAFSESERYMPVLLTQLEDVLEEYGLRHDAVVARMTGCPNGCSRPYLAEIAFIGKAPNTYNIMLGGGYYGERLNKLYKASVKDEDIVDIVRPLFKRWALERNEDEHFGDFCVRVGIIKPTLEGRLIHEDVSEDAY
ncbi:sulfite reductase [NADPH] subunit beta [Monosporozyma unispora]